MVSPVFAHFNPSTAAVGLSEEILTLEVSTSGGVRSIRTGSKATSSSEELTSTPGFPVTSLKLILKETSLSGSSG